MDRDRVRRAGWAFIPGAGVIYLTLGMIGCAPRTLTIETDEYINTAVHVGRSAARTGEPLSIDIVCVYPADLDLEENKELRITTGQPMINARTWFERRPTGNAEADKAANRFSIPRSRIYVLSEDAELRKTGTVKGGGVKGAHYRARPVPVTGIEFSSWGDLHNKNGSVIYVFPRFTDNNGAVLPAIPAAFDPPGAFEKDIAVRIGVDPEGFLKGAPACYGQYIKVTSPRSSFWHSKRDEAKPEPDS